MGSCLLFFCTFALFCFGIFFSSHLLVFISGFPRKCTVCSDVTIGFLPVKTVCVVMALCGNVDVALFPRLLHHPPHLCPLVLVPVLMHPIRV